MICSTSPMKETEKEKKIKRFGTIRLTCDKT